MLKTIRVCTAILSLSLPLNLARAQMTPAKFVPFKTFLQSVRDANAKDFLSRPTSRVKDSAAFEEMRQHILSVYEGVSVSHSYVLDSQTIDCIPVDQQPSVRALGPNKIASPPPPPLPTSPVHPPPVKTDEFGNAMSCPEHTIPMRRITLEQLSRARTLQEFFKKAPSDASHPDHATIPPVH